MPTIQFRVSDDDHDNLQALAHDSDKTLSEVLDDAIINTTPQTIANALQRRIVEKYRATPKRKKSRVYVSQKALDNLALFVDHTGISSDVMISLVIESARS